VGATGSIRVEASRQAVVRGEPPAGCAATEEALRIAVRIARGETGGTLDTCNGPGTGDTLDGDRARQLLEEMLVQRAADVALEWLHVSGLLARLLPEVEATVDFVQEMGRRHKDVWKHTKQVVVQSEPEPAARWAALLHDIGKVPTRSVTPSGKVAFHGHPEVGARMFDRICRRLAFPKPLRTRVRFLIQQHLRASQYDESWTDSAVRRFDREMGEHLDALISLSRADITSARRGRRESLLNQLDELVRRIVALRELDSRQPPLPSGLGNQIMERFGLRPGRLIGQLRGELERAVEAGEIEPHQDAEYYLAVIEARGLIGQYSP